MAKGPRTYGQLCGLALSMDLLGERWTLLIIRELLRGPKRFRDLLDGLDGIGTNLLSARLKSLEEAGVIESVTLPPPASVPAYDLAARGRSLQPILEDLALWGFELVMEESEGDELLVKAAWAAMTMRVVMDRSTPAAPEGIYEFAVGDERFWLRVSGDGSVLRDGPPPFEADAEVEFDTEEFFAVATGALPLTESGAVITGDAARLENLLQTFRLPSAVESASG